VKTAQDLLVKLQHNASAADVGADAGAGGERVGGGGGGGHHEKLYAMMNAVASVLAGQGKDAQAVDLYRSATDGASCVYPLYILYTLSVHSLYTL